ncbi:uncharacterized protein LOC108343895 isoform X1 [Vigna angularis]|uniref:uncharacterized protein LOC108343895 isoform X1 n=1 Tax=Phaseolus angularis TaxID=3914 RepID=UPI0022B38303|nr:uncharacterized protein LOC108343895 isoform X1 [Vigna angularis]
MRLKIAISETLGWFVRISSRSNHPLHQKLELLGLSEDQKRLVTMWTSFVKKHCVLVDGHMNWHTKLPGKILNAFQRLVYYQEFDFILVGAKISSNQFDDSLSLLPRRMIPEN